MSDKGSGCVIGAMKKAVGALHVWRRNIGGINPHFNIMHFQYVNITQCDSWLLNELPNLHGNIIDFGCGSKPYHSLCKGASSVVGVDIPGCETADLYMVDGWRIPVADNSYDGLYSTAAIEHVPDLDRAVLEWKRVLKVGSELIVTMPFLFQVHGAPYDYRRFTEYGIINYFESKGFSVVSTHTFGGIGTYLVNGIQGWIEFSPGRAWLLIQTILIPFYFMYTPALNLLGLLMNRCDKTNAFYTTIGVKLRLDNK